MANHLTPDDYLVLQDEPVDFIELAFSDSMWPIAQQIPRSVRDHPYTVVRNCLGASRSHIAARLALWFLYAFPNSKVITTAPTIRQVKDILWREIRSAKAKAHIPLGGKLNNTSLDLGEQWFAMGLSTDTPERFHRGRGLRRRRGHLQRFRGDRQ